MEFDFGLLRNWGVYSELKLATVFQPLSTSKCLVSHKSKTFKHLGDSCFKMQCLSLTKKNNLNHTCMQRIKPTLKRNECSSTTKSSEIQFRLKKNPTHQQNFRPNECKYRFSDTS